MSTSIEPSAGRAAARRRRSICRPAPPARRRRRRPGHERDRHRAGRDGPPRVSGSDIRERPVLDRAACGWCRGARRSRSSERRGLRRGHRVHGDPGAQHRARRGPRAGHRRPCPRRHAGRRSARRPSRSASPARTARHRPRRCSCSCSPTRGCGRASSSAATSPTWARGAVDGRRVLGRRGRRERRHPSRAAAVRHHPHQRRGRSPRLLRHRRSDRRRLRPVPRRRSPGRRCSAPTTPRARELGRPSWRHHVRDVAPPPTTARSTCRRRTARTPSPSCHAGESLGTVDLPLRGIHNVRNAPARWPWPRSRGRLRYCVARLGQVRGRRPSLRHPRHRRRRDAGRRLRPPADRDRGGARGGAPQRRRLATGRRRVPAEPLQPHGRCLRRTTRRFRRRRSRGAHRHLRVRHDADPRCHRQARRRTPSSTPTRRPRRVDAAARPIWSTTSPRSCGTGDVCISMGCGDVASLPDEVLHRRAELRVGSGCEPSTRATLRHAAADLGATGRTRRAPRPAHHLPRRWVRRRCSSRRERVDDLRRSRRCDRPPRPAGAGRRSRLEPAGGRRRLRWHGVSVALLAGDVTESSGDRTVAAVGGGGGAPGARPHDWRRPV